MSLLMMFIIILILIGLNALYVAGEFSAVSVRRTRIIQLADEGHRIAKMLRPVIEDSAKLDSYIAASQVGITLSSITLGIYGQQQVAPLIVPLLEKLPFLVSDAGEQAAATGTAAFIVLIFLTTLQVILGELLPKSLAIQFPEAFALGTTLPMRWSSDYLLKPLIILLNGSGILLLKLLGMEHGGKHTHIHSPEEIVILVKESHEGGLIDSKERQMLRNVFRVRDLIAGEIAIPRMRLVTAELSTSVAETLKLAANSAYTRIPVYKENVDHIVGFVHLRDLFDAYQHQPNSGLEDIVREVPFLPETLPAIDVWERMNESESYIAVVFDEFGQTAGMISREDLLEELFGELQDEFDKERALIISAGEGRLVVRGDMQIEYLNDLLQIDLPHEISHSIGGLILDQLGRVPTIGDKVEIGNIQLRVAGVNERTVSSVSVELPPEIDVTAAEEIEV